MGTSGTVDDTDQYQSITGQQRYQTQLVGLASNRMPVNSGYESNKQLTEQA